MSNKITELKLIANKYKIICITETHLSVENVKETEIAIPNFDLMCEDRKNNANLGRDSYLCTVHIKNI